MSEEAAQRMRLRETSSVVASSFRSGLWVKDENSFVNVGRVLHDATLQDIRIYRVRQRVSPAARISQARSGKYVRDNLWRLRGRRAHALRAPTAPASSASRRWSGARC